MIPKPVVLLLLCTAVLCLILGPVVVVFLPFGPSALTSGILLLAYGAIGLWIGMKQLEVHRQTEADPEPR